jgi:hypothetical protein
VPTAQPAVAPLGGGEFGQAVQGRQRVSGDVGARWSVMAAVNPAGADGTVLHAVSCHTGDYCMAVGEYIDRATQDVRPVAEQWNGMAWSLTPVPFSAGVALTNLAGVSCVSASDCWAVGWAGSHTLTDHWNGTAWSAGPSPSPQPGQLNTLDGVACRSAADCWAAGVTSHIYQPPGGYNRSLIEHWDGSSWSVAASPPGAVTLSGIACPSGSACLAVGCVKAIIAAAQRWNGAYWRNLSPASPGGSQYWLNAVSCRTAKACEAVGGNPAAGGLAERRGRRAGCTQQLPAGHRRRRADHRAG